MYENENVPIIDGCSCGSKLFLFVKHKRDVKLAEQYRPQLEEKIGEIEIQQKRMSATREYGKSALTRGSNQRPATGDKPKFGVETIKVHDIGVYSIHLDALMKGAPIVVLAKAGSYIISFPTLFEDHELELTLK